MEAHQAMKLQETHARGTMFVGAESIWKAFPANSKPRVSSWAKSHQNSTPVQLCGTCLCLPKNKAKENGHCQKKMLPRLWTTSWQWKAVWKTLFQNKSSGTINPVYLPQATPEQHKECVNQQNTVNHNSCPILLSCNFGGTSH